MLISQYWLFERDPLLFWVSREAKPYAIQSHFGFQLQYCINLLYLRISFVKIHKNLLSPVNQSGSINLTGNSSPLDCQISIKVDTFTDTQIKKKRHRIEEQDNRSSRSKSHRQLPRELPFFLPFLKRKLFN